MTDVGILYPNNVQIKAAKQIFENQFWVFNFEGGLTAKTRFDK